MSAADGGADPVGARDDRFALRDQLVEQGADADLVVGIGPLKGRDLAAHERLELAGAGEGALDTVAHRRDLASNRLRHGEDGVCRKGFRLAEAHGDLADRVGDELHLLRAHGEHGRDQEEDDRRRQGDRRAGDLERRQRARELAEAAAGLEPQEGGEPADPQNRGEACQQVGTAGRPRLQGLQDDADALSIVVRHGGAVGREKRRGVLVRLGGVEFQLRLVRVAIEVHRPRPLLQNVGFADLGQPQVGLPRSRGFLVHGRIVDQRLLHGR